MIPKRISRIDPVVRDRLFAVATKAFVQHGFERASLNSMLAAAGMGKSSFFYYFVDKEDLFASVLEAALAQVARNVGSIILPTDPAKFWEALVAIVERWGAVADAEPGLMGLLRALQPMRRAATSRLSRIFDETRTVHRALLARGVELSSVRNDLSIDIMMALIDAVDLVLDDEFHRNPAPDDDAIRAHRRQVMDVVWRGIRSEIRR
jgi:AcrR family transcriptional regulator